MDSVKFLQNPSRGLVTVARMICELLSEPKSDYLAFTLVCTLDNALKEMEDAYTYPCSNRLRVKEVRNNSALISREIIK